MIGTVGRYIGRAAAGVVALAAAGLLPALVRAENDEAERLRRLEKSLAEEKARNAANEAALRALQDKIDGVARRTGGAEFGGAAEGAVDEDRVRKIVREVLADKATSDQLKKDLGVGGPQAGFRKPVDYQGSAFFIKSGDEFQLNINGRAQIRYHYGLFDPRDRRDGIVIPASKGTVFGGGGLPQKQGTNPNLLNFDDRSDIAIGRFRMHFSGHLYTKNVTYSIQLDASTRGNDAAIIDEAWVNWNVFGGDKEVPVEFQDALHFRFGQYYTVWGRWERQAQFQSQTSWSFLTMDHPPPTTFFYPDRNPGLEVRGVIGGVNGGALAMLGLAPNELPADRPGTKGFVEYNLTVTNGWQSAGRRYGYENDTGAGIPTTARETDIRPAAVARLGFDVLKGKYVGEDGKDYYLFGRNQGDLEHHETPALGTGFSFAWMRVRGQDRPLNNIALGAFYRPPLLVSFDDDFCDSYWYAFDMAFKWMGFSLQGELYYNRIRALNGPFVAGQVPTQDQDIWGWYLQAGYFVLPHELEAYLQWSGAQAGRTPNWNGILDPAAIPPLNNTNAPTNNNFVFGFNYYPFHSVNVKLTAEGAILINNPISNSRAGWVSASRENNYQARLQVQVGF
jgi:hypothetical protein